MTDVLAEARRLTARGFRVVPLPPTSKRPVLTDWTALRLADADLPAHFHGRGNLGLLNGTPSGLVDVDLDCPEAVAAAPLLLPPTGMASGRPHARTHWWYRVENPPPSAKYADPAPAGGVLCELRSTGSQSLVPPSVYPADDGTAEEPCVWHADGDPAAVPLADLRSAVGAVAAAALLARHWPTGSRHDLALAVAGGLLRAGWGVDRVERFLAAACAAAGDGEVEDRVRTAADTAAKLAAGKPVKGWPSAAKLLGTHGEVIVRRIREWLGVTIVPSGPNPAGGPKPYTPPPPYVPFPLDALPRVIRDLASACEAAMGCDPAYAALPALGVCAGMIGATRVIELKSSWREPAMVWAVVVGESGTLKTPPFKLTTRPVNKLQAEYFKRHKLAMETHRRELRDYETEKRRCGREGGDPGDPPTPPSCTRVSVRDTTVEALAPILNDNRTRLVVARDEVSGWLASFNQYKAKGGSDLANWLELHSLGTLAVDRKTGDVRTIFIPEVGVSLCGGVQPGVLKKSVSAEQMAAGIPARLLFAYPTRRPKRWTEAEVADAVYRAYADAVEKLTELRPATDDHGDPVPVPLRLTPAAKKVWVAFYNGFADRQAQTDGEIAAAFSKLEGYAARLALLHHVVESVTDGGEATDPVGEPSIRAGIRMAEWFADEAERVYRLLGEGDEERELNALVALVGRLAGRNGGRVTVQNLQRANSRKYRSKEAAESDLESLVSRGLGTWEDVPPGPKGGRAVRAFIPCTTHDVSDTTPNDEGEGLPPPHDTTPGGGFGPAPPTAGGSVASPDESKASAIPPVAASEVVSETSCVVQGGRPTERDPGPELGLGGCVVQTSLAEAPDLTLVDHPDGVGRVVAAVEDHGGPVGLDTETTGLDPRSARVRLLQLAVGPDTFVVDLFALPDPAAELADLFEALARVEVVAHNAQFDLRMLAPLGFAPGPAFCTLLASQVLHAGERADNGVPLRHTLDAVVGRELGRTLDKAHQTADWAGSLTPAMLAYAAADARVLPELADALKAQLVAADLTATADREMMALPGIAWAAPVTVDADAWAALADRAHADAARLVQEMEALAPNPGDLFGGRNWNSPDQIKAAFQALGVTLTSTDDDTLAAADHPLAEALRDYRSAVKRSGAYGTRWLADHAPDGTVLCRWNQCGAESGRMSSAEPNLQQIPRTADYRRCFTARPGNALVKADYSQIELRIAARLTGEAAMTDAYARGHDLHALTAARVLHKPTDAVTRADRQLAKAVNFGLLFGMGWKALRAYARANYGVNLTDGEARAYRAAFFKAYPALAAWHDRVGREVKRRFRSDPAGTHEVRTLGGRRRVLPVAKGTPPDRYPNVTEALNFPVQGTGADGLKAAIARLWERRAECPGVVPVLFCHDEVVVECPAADANRVRDWLVRCMTDGMAPLIDPVPVAVEASVGRTWGGN